MTDVPGPEATVGVKSSNRFLLGFGIAIGVLVVASVVLVLALGGRTSPLLPENTPEGTVQRFLQAVEQQDWAKAYSYLGADRSGRKLTFDEWHRSIPVSGGRAGWKAALGSTVTSGDEVAVEVVVDVFRPNGPFEDPVDTFRLNYSLRREGDTWKIITPADLWWLY